MGRIFLACSKISIPGISCTPRSGAQSTSFLHTGFSCLKPQNVTWWVERGKMKKKVPPFHSLHFSRAGGCRLQSCHTSFPWMLFWLDSSHLTLWPTTWIYQSATVITVKCYNSLFAFVNVQSCSVPFCPCVELACGPEDGQFT